MSVTSKQPTVELSGFDPLEQAALTKLKAKANHAFVTGAGGFLGKAICKQEWFC